MLKFLVFAALLGLSVGEPAPLRYPANNPCVLADIDASIHMSWTDSDGNVATVPDFTFADGAVIDGSCAKDTPVPQLVLSLKAGSITFTLRFQNNTDTFKNVWTMRYSPEAVYKNDITATVQHAGDLGSGVYGKAFACVHVPVVNDSKEAVGMNKFDLSITIKSFKSQAFGVTNGQYGEVERCEADGTDSSPNPASTEPTPKPTTVTSAPTTKPEPETSPNKEPTTEPAGETTKPTNGTTEPTTKPTNGTTEPTTKPTNGTTEPTTKPTNGTTEPTTKPTNGTTEPTTNPPASSTPVPATSSHPKLTFGVYTSSGEQCILMVGEFLFTLAYTKTDDTNTTVDVGLQEINEITGNCNMTDADAYLLTVKFYKTWQMDLTISKSGSSMMLGADGDTKYHWSNLVLQYDLSTKLGGKPLFPDAKIGNETSLVELNTTFGAGTYEASSDGSYLCNANQDLGLGGDNKLQVSSLQYHAQLGKNSTTFPDKNLTECSADSKTSSVVPIAVGAALAGLVVIVLIAYLIGRRRNRKGYESV